MHVCSTTSARSGLTCRGLGDRENDLPIRSSGEDDRMMGCDSAGGPRRSRRSAPWQVRRTSTGPAERLPTGRRTASRRIPAGRPRRARGGREGRPGVRRSSRSAAAPRASTSRRTARRSGRPIWRPGISGGDVPPKNSSPFEPGQRDPRLVHARAGPPGPGIGRMIAWLPSRRERRVRPVQRSPDPARRPSRLRCLRAGRCAIYGHAAETARSLRPAPMAWPGCRRSEIHGLVRGRASPRDGLTARRQVRLLARRRNETSE